MSESNNESTNSCKKKNKLVINENEIIEKKDENLEKFINDTLLGDKEDCSIVLNNIDDLYIDHDETIKEKLDNSNIVRKSPDDLIVSMDKESEGISKELKELKEIKNDPLDLLEINIQQGSQLQKYIEDPTENDDLYNSIDKNKPTVTILNNIMKEIAEEIAFLKTWRRENFNLKDDISEISERRIVMLNKLVDTIDKREKLLTKSSRGKIDFYGEGFKNIFEDFLMTVEKTFTGVNIPEQFKNIFFAQLAKSMDGFEKKAENIYYGKKKLQK